MVKPDKIHVKTDPKAPKKSRVRWTRRAPNGKVIAASTEGYSRVDSALKNVWRTQKGPFDIILDDDPKNPVQLSSSLFQAGKTPGMN